MNDGEYVADWTALRAMSAKERRAAAMSDPDARPFTAAQWKRAKLVPRTITLRRAFRLTQEQFAAQFGIPVGTLRDWEQRRKEPDAAARAYLQVIAANPDAVRAALKPPKPPKPKLHAAAKPGKRPHRGG